MRQANGKGYFLIQKRALDILWDMVELEDRTAFWLILTIIEHCENATGSPRSRAIDGQIQQCRRTANSLVQAGSNHNGMPASDRHSRYVMLQEKVIRLIWDAARLQDELMIWLLKLLLLQCDETVTSLLAISWNAAKQS